jgi:hypothetical protein
MGNKRPTKPLAGGVVRNMANYGARLVGVVVATNCRWSLHNHQRRSVGNNRRRNRRPTTRTTSTHRRLTVFYTDTQRPRPQWCLYLWGYTQAWARGHRDPTKKKTRKMVGLVFLRYRKSSLRGLSHLPIKNRYGAHCVRITCANRYHACAVGMAYGFRAPGDPPLRRRRV